MCRRCDDLRPLTELELLQAELYKQMVLDSLLYGFKAGQGYGKNYKAAEKIRAQARANFPVPSILSNLDNVQQPATISADRIAKPKMPQEICKYRKPKVYWFGELHGSNNLAYNPGWGYNSEYWVAQSRHWKIIPDKLTLKGRDPKDGLSVFPSVPMGSTTGRHEAADPFKGKRFIGISEPAESEQIDNDFLKRFTGDEWVETRTLSKPHVWKPQGKIFVTSGKPLKINDKSKETIERVERIEYPGD